MRYLNFVGSWRRKRMSNALVAAAIFGLARIASAQTAFYDAPESLLAGAPGTLVRQESMDGAPLGASTYRVLYRSTGLNRQPIFVSGVVIVPQGAPPPGGRAIVAWAHPTSGIVPRCAPSLAIFLFQQIQGLRSMIARGFVVVATDYPGLGTPGPHPYLVGESEGSAVIDIVRAARSLPRVGEGKDFIVWGHSQGGQAALFAGMMANDYAPELKLLGVAAAAPATDLAKLMSDDINSIGGKNITAMTLWSWHRVYGAAIDNVVDPRAMPAIDRLAQECIEGPFDLIVRQRTGRPLEQYFLMVQDPTKAEPWRSLLEQNSTGVLSPEIPIFLAQGTNDQIIQPAVTQAYMDRLCKAGSKVRMIMLPGIGHGRAAQASTMAAVNWMTDRFARKTPPDDCVR
ncbi:alpha/beta fold hydrolase [Bradyrhizobium sp. BWA-3-5]|uniref:alpha/beta fold hydrolase n=1 Tax=Bradyrhizobium sp. BWA-3-5 TaxID=3080013 RepID=UPI00293EE0A9|nr:alpha/beta fold hydrolase [Bradyrhizobium sp. BWA-3-5]WOH67118.1 alpha/beta fold hydrolase [Bradyrhizobium sp. BWA-3-5]